MKRILLLLAAVALAMTPASLLAGDRSLTPILPDPNLTPGAVLPVTVADIARRGYTRTIRDVPESVRRAVYAEYGITSHAPREYEIDHLVLLELGGSNSIRNLWPESYKTQPWTAYAKDTLEDRLHKLVVTGQLALPTAQREIASDWIAAYKKYLHREIPPAKGHPAIIPSTVNRAPAADAPKADPSVVRVWVNLNSGVYHLPGSKWYGKTANGRYMSEQSALEAGYRGAGNE